MSFQKLKTNTYCVGQKHNSGTRNIVGEIKFNKKTGKDIKLLVGKCMICDRKKSMIVSENIIQAEGLGGFLKNLRRICAKPGRKLATNVSKNPGRALEATSNIATVVSRKTKSPKAALSSLPEVVNFYHTGKRLYLGKFVKIMLYK